MSSSFGKSLILFLFIGLVIRLVHSLWHPYLVHPDEHFQVLEPAFRSVYGFGLRTWEWARGTRSWVGPGLFIPLIWLGKLAGLKGGAYLLLLCKAGMIGIWFLSGWFFARVLREGFSFSESATLLGVILYGCSATLVTWTTTTFSEMESLLVVWITLPFVFVCARKNSSFFQYYGGAVLVTLPFLLRVQMLAWSLPFALGVYLFFKPTRKAVLGGLSGFLSVLFFQGILDYFTLGSFFQSPLKNIQVNLIEKASNKYGTSPEGAYFELLWKALDPSLRILTVLSLGGVGWLLIRRWKKGRALGVNAEFSIVLIAALGYFSIHSLIPHKEIRFLLPVFPVLVVLIAWIWNELSEIFGSFRPKLEVALRVTALLGPVWLLSAVWPGPQLAGDNTVLSDHVYDWVNKNGIQKPEICLVDSQWYLTRGWMGVGAPGSYLIFTGEGFSKLKKSPCDFVILNKLGQRGNPMNAGLEFKMVEEDSLGHQLWIASRYQGEKG